MRIFYNTDLANQRNVKQLVINTEITKKHKIKFKVISV